MKRNQVVKLAIIAAVVAGLLWLNQQFLQFSPQDLRVWMLAAGWYAPLIYFVLYTVRPLILFPPSILSLAGGLAFGPIWGTVLTVLSATSSASVSFFVARKLGKNMFAVPLTGKTESIQHHLEQRGLIYVLLVRLIPLIPFDLISYTAGMSRIRFRSFFWGTLIGIVPGTFAYNLLGSSIAGGNWQEWLVAGIVFVAAMIIPLRFRKWLDGGEQS